jgi:hypothetical protein
MIIYNPKDKTISCGCISEPFYSGSQLDNIGHVLARLRFGEMTLQQAHGELVSEFAQITHELLLCKSNQSPSDPTPKGVEGSLWNILNNKEKINEAK